MTKLTVLKVLIGVLKIYFFIRHYFIVSFLVGFQPTFKSIFLGANRRKFSELGQNIIKKY